MLRSKLIHSTPCRVRGLTLGLGVLTGLAVVSLSFGQAANPAVTETKPTVAETKPAAAAVPASTEPVKISVTLEELGLKGSVSVRDLWSHQYLGTMTDSITATVNSHGAVLYRVHSL